MNGKTAASFGGTLLYKDTLIVALSDMHSGGSGTLFPNREIQFRYGNHRPDERQRRLYHHWKACIQHAATLRKNKRLVIVHNGDALEGVHHKSIANITFTKKEQAEIHTELMDEFMRGAKFGKDDKLYYVNGTEAHTGDHEHGIAKDLGAEGGRAHDFLDLTVNNKHIWFVHHGAQKGTGYTEGNALRLWLGKIYWDCLKDKRTPPDVVVTGHYHAVCYNTFVMDFHTLHGVICPSWQLKTRYAWQKAPVSKNEIGAVFINVRADGFIQTPEALVMDMDERTKVRV